MAGPAPLAAAPAATPTGNSAEPGQKLLRPQSAWAQTLGEQGRARGPGGLGLDVPGMRERLVRQVNLDGCQDAAVLAAIAAVPRHVFVDTALAAQAYEDTALPIGHGQTISKPSVVARMLALLRERPPGAPPAPPLLGRVLEIGTGCGYQAALLARLARMVVSIERVRPLFDLARENLVELRGDRVRLVYGDGRLGHGPNAPYDGIIAAAGGDDLPEAWLQQLAPGGRLVVPWAHAPGQQRLVVIDRLADGQLQRQDLEAVRFVPLQSGVTDAGWR
jgi:protein-L-isoaspartate(D-aspartate) O-methyltransferase